MKNGDSIGAALRRQRHLASHLGLLGSLRLRLQQFRLSRAASGARLSLTSSYARHPVLCRYVLHQIPVIDIIIDDGGHTSEQQIVTFEEAFPHLRPGGVYICEDVHGLHHPFLTYINGLSHHLNQMDFRRATEEACPTAFQRTIHSIHLYPYLVVIVKNPNPVDCFMAPKKGTLWQDFPPSKS